MKWTLVNVRIDPCTMVLVGERSRNQPWFISISVMVCQRFMATNQVLSFRRQLRSKTSLDRSPPSADRTDSSRSLENLPSGKRNDVMITCTGAISLLSEQTECLSLKMEIEESAETFQTEK